LARALAEASARSWYLLEPDIGPLERVRRLMNDRLFSLFERHTMWRQEEQMAALLDLPELAALLAAARIVVCNNSAPAHIAAAVGTPVVDLYALTNPQHTPWGVEHRVLSRDVDCKYCVKSVCPQGHHRCLADISPAEIVAAVDALLPDIPVRGRPRMRAPVSATASA